MSSIAKLNYDKAQLALIKRTYAKDCNSAEFDLFMQNCAHMGLDPFKREIYVQIFSKDKPDKRQMVLVVGIDGLRRIAESYSNYRPDDEEAIYTYDKELKSNINPLGILSCSVKAWKYDNRGNWHKVNGTAYWDEFAPVEDVWDWSSGKAKKTNEKKLKDMWQRMPRQMIAKCAEAQALRKGWPATGFYAQEELENSIIKDVTPSQAVNDFEKEKQLNATKAVGTVMFQWMAGQEIVAEPTGGLADKIIEFVRKIDNEPQLNAFESINKQALRQFWAMDKSAALEVKKELEQKKVNLTKEQR